MSIGEGSDGGRWRSHIGALDRRWKTSREGVVQLVDGVSCCPRRLGVCPDAKSQSERVPDREGRPTADWHLAPAASAPLR